MLERHPLAIRFAALIAVAFLADASRAAACSPELSDSGLGGIIRDTAFDRDAVARAVPGCKVELGAGSSEAAPVDTLAITDGTTPVALVFPDWAGGIFSVEVRNPAVRDRLGTVLGVSFAAVYGGTAPDVCVPGVWRRAPGACCARRPPVPGWSTCSRATVGGREQATEIPDAGAFVAAYGRRLTPAFVAAVRDEPAGQVHIDDNGAALASGRVWIAPVCSDDSCTRHRAGVTAVSMF